MIQQDHGSTCAYWMLKASHPPMTWKVWHMNPLTHMNQSAPNTYILNYTGVIYPSLISSLVCLLKVISISKRMKPKSFHQRHIILCHCADGHISHLACLFAMLCSAEAAAAVFIYDKTQFSKGSASRTIMMSCFSCSKLQMEFPLAYLFSRYIGPPIQLPFDMPC